jgi:hypothetical protein
MNAESLKRVDSRVATRAIELESTRIGERPQSRGSGAKAVHVPEGAPSYAPPRHLRDDAKAKLTDRYDQLAATSIALTPERAKDLSPLIREDTHANTFRGCARVPTNSPM